MEVKIVAMLLFFGSVAFLMPYSWLLLQNAYDSPQQGQTSDIQSETESDVQELLPDSPTTVEDQLIQSNEEFKYDEFLIYCSDRSGVLTVPVKEYLIGALAAEMPLNYPKEVLKAQVIAAYSYAVARAENKEQGESPMNSDFTANPSNYEGFLTENELHNIWGNSYDENYEYLSEIVDEVSALILTYDGEPALSCYFPLSNGVTLPSSSVFDVELPYLTSVDSTYDKESVEYEQKITFTSQQIFDVLTTSFVGVELCDDHHEWLSNPNYDNYGYLTDISAGEVVISGEELRSSLGLRSTSIQIEYSDNIFIFTTQGSRHCVGMSQYGAKMMAENGYTYDIILEYYYPGTEISIN